MFSLAALTAAICSSEIGITWLTVGSPQAQIPTVCQRLKQKDEQSRNHKTQYGLKAAWTDPVIRRAGLARRNETPVFKDW